MKHGKKYIESAKLIESSKLYDPDEAVKLALQTAKTKFDETMEISVRLGVDPRQADQQVRGAVVLPHGTGKKVRVLVFAKGEQAKAAEEAGADYVGAEELVAKIQGENWFDFDVVVATPNMMGVGLGGRGGPAETDLDADDERQRIIGFRKGGGSDGHVRRRAADGGALRRADAKRIRGGGIRLCRAAQYERTETADSIHSDDGEKRKRQGAARGALCQPSAGRGGAERNAAGQRMDV